MRFKHGTKGLGFHPSMRAANMAAERVWQNHGRELVITCPPETDDYAHSKHSWHWYGCAVDYRTRYWSPAEITVVADDLRRELLKVSPRYQVVVERNHIHVEYEWCD